MLGGKEIRWWDQGPCNSGNSYLPMKAKVFKDFSNYCINTSVHVTDQWPWSTVLTKTLKTMSFGRKGLQQLRETGGMADMVKRLLSRAKDNEFVMCDFFPAPLISSGSGTQNKNGQVQAKFGHQQSREMVQGQTVLQST